MAEKEGFEVSVAKTSFKANTKALAENEGEGLAKVIFNLIPAVCLFVIRCGNLTISILLYFVQLIYRPDNGEILGVHIFGLHAADLIHEASNAIALGTRIQVIQLHSVNAHTFVCRIFSGIMFLKQLSC